MALLALIAILLGLPAITLASESSTTTSPSSSSARPTLQLVRIDPLTVAGRGFKRGERVSVSANGRRKFVVAGVNGGFTISFRGLGSCGAVIVARGSEGSRASLSFDFSNVHCLEPGVMGTAGLPAARKAVLRVVANLPLTVRGEGFQPSERIRLTALGSIKRLTRTTTASQRGVFKARFTELNADRCSLLVIAAVGSMGSRASAKVFRRPCNPPRVPPRRQ